MWHDNIGARGSYAIKEGISYWKAWGQHAGIGWISTKEGRRNLTCTIER